MLPVITVRLIAHLGSSNEPLKAKHNWWGGPGTTPIPMPRPDVLLLEGDEFGHAMIYRYTAGGVFGGDTWHESVEIAKESAAEEYGESVVGPWQPVPDNVQDPYEFVIRKAAERASPIE
jgi:hypothetical protein